MLIAAIMKVIVLRDVLPYSWVDDYLRTETFVGYLYIFGSD